MLPPLLDHLRVGRVAAGRPRTTPDRLRGDKAYSSRETRALLRRRRIQATIPERRDQIANRKRRGARGGRPPAFDPADYKARNVVEGSFNDLKQWRGLTTRYDKLAIVYRGGAVLNAIIRWLKRLRDTPYGFRAPRSATGPWRVRDSNPRRLRRLIYSQIPLATWVTRRGCSGQPETGWPEARPQRTGEVAPSGTTDTCRASRVARGVVSHRRRHAGRGRTGRSARRPAGTDGPIAFRWPVERCVLHSLPMADSSFDIVSKVDTMEAENAVNQARKELEQRYDFKGVGASVELKGEAVTLKAASEERVHAVLDVLQSKLIKRGISLKSLDLGEPFASGKEYRLEGKLKNGIDSEHAKKIGKLIRDEAPKTVKSQIQGDELRVQSKNRDDLQATIALLKGADLDLDLQFVNFR